MKKNVVCFIESDSVALESEATYLHQPAVVHGLRIPAETRSFISSSTDCLTQLRVFQAKLASVHSTTQMCEGGFYTVKCSALLEMALKTWIDLKPRGHPFGVLSEDKLPFIADGKNEMQS